MKRFDLEGGCYVLAGVWDADQPLIPVIGRDFGAKHISQMAIKLDGPSPIFQFGQSDVILFVVKGQGRAQIGGRTFPLYPHSGLYVRPGEAFQISPSPQSPPTRGEEEKRIPSPLMGEGQGEGDPSFKAILTVCPEEPSFRLLKTMPGGFDETAKTRTVSIDPAKKEAMGERFYQVLVSKQVGSRKITQFIGEIPKSRAPSHHHLYEEAIYVLDGEGFMWTGDKKAPVKRGSVIFLPIKQDHSLECTSKSGLKLAGHFYPAGSPAENY